MSCLIFLSDGFSNAILYDIFVKYFKYACLFDGNSKIVATELFTVRGIMLNIEDLESEIEYLRRQLVATYMKQGSFNSPVVLEVSEELDVLLNSYDCLKSGKYCVECN